MNNTTSVYNQSAMMGGSSETMSMYTPSMMMMQQPQQNGGGSVYGGHQSMVMPSSTSMPMMPYSNSVNNMMPMNSSNSVHNMMPMNSNRSMASFAPAAQSFNQPGQYIPMQQSPQFGNSNSSQSIMMDGFAMGDNPGPKNEEIMNEVQRILSTADLTKVTKKQVREELQTVFGVNMASRKDYINACIENVLQNRG
jgi:chitin synthase